jgi:hypothetical protein
MQGQMDFGIVGSNELPVVQVISKNLQFSCWNSYKTQNKPFSQLAPSVNIPATFAGMQFPLKVPVDSTDEFDVINVLCPEITQNVINDPSTSATSSGLGWNKPVEKAYDDVWQRGIELSIQLVADPGRYRQLFAVNPAPITPIFYYTNGINLKFANRQPVKDLIYTDPVTQVSLPLPLISSTGECSNLEIFSAPPGTNYGI